MACVVEKTEAKIQPGFQLGVDFSENYGLKKWINTVLDVTPYKKP